MTHFQRTILKSQLYQQAVITETVWSKWILEERMVFFWIFCSFAAVSLDLTKKANKIKPTTFLFARTGFLEANY